MTIWKVTRRYWRINTGIRRKQQGCGREMKLQYVFVIRYLPIFIFYYFNSKFWNQFFPFITTSNLLSPKKHFGKSATDPWQCKFCSSALTMAFYSPIISLNRITAAVNHKTVHLMIWFIKYLWCLRVITMNNFIIERH